MFFFFQINYSNFFLANYRKVVTKLKKITNNAMNRTFYDKSISTKLKKKIIFYF